MAKITKAEKKRQYQEVKKFKSKLTVEEKDWWNEILSTDKSKIGKRKHNIDDWSVNL